MTTKVVFRRITFTGLPKFRCDIRMDKLGRTLDSDGDPLPHDSRPFECGKDGLWLMGSQPVCDRHFREVCHVAELDPDEIEDDWRAML